MTNSLKIVAVVTTLAVGALAVGSNIESVAWEYSVAVPDFVTGDLKIGEWGETDTGQILFNIDGVLRSLDEYEADYSMVDVLALTEVVYKGSRYEDHFKDKSVRLVSKNEYQKVNRKPTKNILNFANTANASIVNEVESSIETSYVNSITLGLDCTGVSDAGVITVIANRNHGDNISGITYNAVAMDLELLSENLNTAGVSIWSRNAVDSGNHNVVLTNVEYRLHNMWNVCLSGTDQSDIVEANSGQTVGWSSSVSENITSLTDGAWLLSGINLKTNQALTPDSGETELHDIGNSDGSLGQIGVSYFEKTTAGVETLGWSWPSGDNYGFAIVAIKPSIGAPPTIKKNTPGLITFD